MKEKIINLRHRTGLSQTKFALLLGVAPASLRRWEKGEVQPSLLALKRIEEVAALSDQDLLELASNIVIKEDIPDEKAYSTSFVFRGKKHKSQWMPFVVNGPNDQKDFYYYLKKIQEESNTSLDEKTYFKNLSLFSSVDGVETSQYLMERPSKKAKSWSSDYGTHGFHRYVGRFPSHLIRALINNFMNDENDVFLDPFCGSGTMLVEARMMGVNSVGIEISPLSAMISRVKSQFPSDGFPVSNLISEYTDFYQRKMCDFLKNRSIDSFSYEEILSRKGNTVSSFPNIEKWFTKEALVGVSISVEFILNKNGYEKDFLTIALSSKMRSIGNVDVDVVRAEYRKTPRIGVDVLKIMQNQIKKMSASIADTIKACGSCISDSKKSIVIEGDVLSSDIESSSIPNIITSPPYGVESLSYLRTHLLSFRGLESILGVDPYNFGKNVIGSEYLEKNIPDVSNFKVAEKSKTYSSYFKELLKTAVNSDKKRIFASMKFFEDMCFVIERFKMWLKPEGKVAFVIGNKKIGDSIIPTDQIIREIFISYGFYEIETVQHKLKTNNSNSQVPWQDRIIENEFVMIFRKRK